MAEPRRIVLADPLARGGRTRFAVTGQGAPGAPGNVKMYEWDGAAENMSMVGLQTDVGGGIKSLAWSPHPAQRHLLALGLSTGRVHLIALSPSSLTLPLRGTPARTSILSIKHSRAVTSMAFSSRDPNLLAVGYDRHRSDHSLLIWDVNDIVGSLPPDPDGDSSYIRTPDRLEVTNTSGGQRDSPRHLQQYCAGEVVHSVAWMPASSAELYASATNKTIRLYDLRIPSREAGGMGPTQWATRAVHFLTPDPAHPTRLVSVETTPQAGIVRLWDVRKPGVEITGFEVTEGGTIVDLEWAPGSSQLAVGTRDGGVNVCSVVNGPEKFDGTYEWVAMGDVRHVVKPKQQLHSFAFTPPTTPTSREIVFVVKDGTIGVGPIGQAPAIAASPCNEFTIAGAQLQVIDVEASLRTTQNTPGGSRPHSRPQSRSSSPHRNPGDDTRRNRFQLAPERVSALLVAESENRSRSASPGLIRGRGSRRDLPSLLEEPDETEDFNYRDEVQDADGLRFVLKHDPAYIMRRRAEGGYGLSLEQDKLHLNAAIASRCAGGERIAGIWEFVEHFVRATNSQVSVHGGYDLTYQGIWPIWTGLLGDDGREDPHPSSSASLRPHNFGKHDASASGGTTPRRRALDSHDAQYNAVIASINSSRTVRQAIAAPGNHRLPHTDKAPLRRMMLAVCGENNSYDTMEEVNRLVDDNQRTKAACWAYFAGEDGLAGTILMRSDDEKHRLMGATIVGFMTQATAERGSVFWQEHWRTMVDKVDDPYVRAVLARIAGENWEGILYDESLPLLDRVAVAVCNLSDKDLTAFLHNRLNRCIQMGALPGLALTGFTHNGVTLLQHFVDRTGDVQTAALIASFFPRSRLLPRETDVIDRWTESYRTLLDSWSLWVERCAFDVAVQDQRRALGEPLTDAITTVVVCPVCNVQLTKQTEELLTRKNALRTAIRAPNVRTTTCVYCQNALARCCVCLLHVTPTADVDQDRVDSLGTAFVSCQTCRHGGHAAHILGWFEGGLDGEPAHDVCPVAGCECQCASL